jgi:hypothetical protein
MAHRLISISLVERRRLAGLARNPRCRQSKHTPQRPCEWNPMGTATPTDPTYCFTGPGAWAFIAEYLESTGDIYSIALDKPPNGIGYVIFLPATPVWRGLYAKFEVAGVGLYGRSFHHPLHLTLDIERTQP